MKNRGAGLVQLFFGSSQAIDLPAPKRFSAPTLLWNTVRAIPFCSMARAALLPILTDVAIGSSSVVGGSTQNKASAPDAGLQQQLDHA